jgi:periplasmic divalent cation tolerance protein
MTAQQDSGYCMAMTACGSREEAERLATALVEGKVAACVQVLQSTSFYTWKGALTSEAEQLLLIKTRRSLYPAVEELLLRLHSYETPEIICLPIHSGAAGYFAWIDEVTAGDGGAC